MFKNYLLIAFRNLIRQRIYSIINISGLAIGFAAFILIVLHVIHEFSFDKFHENADDIYRVCINGRISGDVFNVAVCAPPMGEAMVRDIPEVLKSVRIKKIPQNVLFSTESDRFYEDGMIFADSTFFEIFSFGLLAGNPETVLDEPNSIVISEKIAKKHFRNENPVGKTIKLNDKENLVITGVMMDVPGNSHFSFTMVTSFINYLRMTGRDGLNDWGSLSVNTYVLLASDTDPNLVNSKFPEFLMKNLGELSEMESIKFEPYLQPMTSIHLHSNLMAELGSNSDINYVYAFLAIAVFVLLIACINFMNLSTARSIKRAKEVGLRKVVGADRKQLIFQFIGESLILSFIGLIVGLILVELALPSFNQMLDKEFGLNLFQHGYNLLYLIGLAILVGLIAGSYPAFYLSAFQPIRVLKGSLRNKTKKSSVRNVLVVVQFSISVFLIICTGFVYSQMNYIRNKKLGFDKEQLVVIPLRGDRMQDNANAIKNEMKNLSCVSNVSMSKFVPGGDMDGTGYHPEGMDEKAPWIIFTNVVDYDYVKTMGMEIVMGRDFSREFSTDSSAILINETLMKKLGWEDPLNKKISGYHFDSISDLHIVGVVKDFHFRSLHDAIEPVLMYVGSQNHSNLNVKLQPGNITENIEAIQKKWEDTESSFPFDYFILDKDLENLYKAESRIGELFLAFTFIAILIACLGLFGLASYNAEQRTREIGIRKALGSSVEQIVFLISKQFTVWIILANIIAWPLAYYFIDRWLGNFAYSVKITDKWYIFFVAGIVTLVIAILTVLYQSIKAAITNPVQAIKYE
jgi:putative ABC transport system permease protein